MHVVLAQKHVRTAFQTIQQVFVTQHALYTTLVCSGQMCVVQLQGNTSSISVQLQARVLEAGSCVLDAQQLFPFMRELQMGDLTLQTEILENGKKYCTIGSHDMQGTFLCQAPLSPAVSPLSPPHEICVLSAASLGDIIQEVAFAAAPIDHPFFACVCVLPTIDALEFIATDGAHMAHRVFPCIHTLTQQLLVPAQLLSPLADLLFEAHTSVRCLYYEQERLIAFAYDTVEYRVKLHVGAYPHILNIYPPHYAVVAELPVAALLAAVKRAYFAGTEICLEFTADKVCVTGSNEDQRVVTMLPTAVSGGPFTVRISYEYLIEVLEVIRASTVKLCCDPFGPQRALVCIPEGLPHLRYSIMPLLARR